MKNLKLKIKTCYCNCKPEQSIAFGGTTEFYSDRIEAVQAVIDYVTSGSSHWCVHFNNEHILKVKVNGEWYGGIG